MHTILASTAASFAAVPFDPTSYTATPVAWTDLVAHRSHLVRFAQRKLHFGGSPMGHHRAPMLKCPAQQHYEANANKAEPQILRRRAVKDASNEQAQQR